MFWDTLYESTGAWEGQGPQACTNLLKSAFAKYALPIDPVLKVLTNVPQGPGQVQEGEGAAGAVGEHGHRVSPLHHYEVAPLIYQVSPSLLKAPPPLFLRLPLINVKIPLPSLMFTRPAKSEKFPTTGISRIEISPKRA